MDNKKDNRQPQTKAKARLLKGIVFSDKMNKTIVVNEYKIGDKAVIQECRPMSRDKRWIAISKT